VQLGTVRFLDTFFADPSEVPRGVVACLARQLGIADTSGLKRYAAGVMRRDHVAEIRRSYGYRDFHEGSEAVALSRWLANRAWVSAERPSVLFDPATARLVERKVLLPGVTVLARLVAQVRDQAASRLWRTLARALKPGQAARLETLLVADESSRQSPLERLRRAPTRVSVAGMVEALERLREIRALGVGHIDLSPVPPVRVQAVARFAAAARAQAIARMPPPRRHATLLAFAKIQETAALDDVVDLLDQLVTATLARVEAASWNGSRTASDAATCSCPPAAVGATRMPSSCKGRPGRRCGRASAEPWDGRPRRPRNWRASASSSTKPIGEPPANCRRTPP
jgi:Domain of unknown function (DUF4158)